MYDDLKLIVLDSHKELGEKINRYLQLLNNTDKDFRISNITPRFNNGEAKGVLLDSVREKDVYILTDVQNYSITYKIRTFLNHMSPDDHYQDIKRIISAMSGHSAKTNVIMPFLYGSRQHKKAGKESLDCAMALRELESLRVNNVITVDVHDPGVAQVLPYGSFTSYSPRQLLIKQLLEDYPDMSDIVVIAPDSGAKGRATYVADKLGNVGLGFFDKRRDLTKVVDGKNPILNHEYFGNDVDGKNVIIVDDMISSGTSILKTAGYLKEKGAKRVYMFVSFALFDEGIEKFNEAYDKGMFDKIYATNGAYIDTWVLNSEWFQVVDISMVMANIINDLHYKKSLEKYLRK